MIRARLDLAYDGTEFHGWAPQPGLRTVAGELEAALAVVYPGEPPTLTAAGRTDAGVHARGQVAHADLPDGAAPARLAARLNRLLPADVRVLACRAAPDGFDARFSALSRAYTYRVVDAVPDPVRRRDTYAYSHALDVAGMTAAAAALVGERDFAAFCRRRPGASTVRTLLRLQCTRADDGVVLVDAEADAFCHQMVRSLVGALLAVGSGRRPPEWVAEVTARGVRDPAVVVAPPHGLTLVAVRYPPDGELGARARQTRARRDDGRGEAAGGPAAGPGRRPGEL